VSFEVEGLEHENPIPAACRKGNVIISSGIFGAIPEAGVSAKNRKVPPTIEEEAAQMFRNMKTVVEAAGGTLADIVSVSIWVTDKAFKPLVNVPWREMFPDPHSRPTRDTDEVPKLSHGCRIRCKFIAVVG
jgi:enamine deaminase RidA (YjgF/YER057c/UK114 family)